MNVDELLALPIVAGVAIFFMESRSARGFAAGACLLQILLGASLCLDSANPEHLVSRHEWLSSLGLSWSLGLDGANMWLVLLCPVLTLLAVLSMKKVERTGQFAGSLVLLNGLLCGLFLAQNLGLFYIFFEAMLLPALILVAGWSRRQGRETAFTFLMYTLAGSLPMLLGILVIAFTLGGATGPNLDFNALEVPEEKQFYLLFPFLLAFCIKMPVVPFHGWLPALYRNAPAPAVAVIAALMSKAGTYGLFKVGFTLFPSAMQILKPYLLVMGLISLLYGALAALGANSLREILAYSSLSHIAMILLGISAVSRIGAAGASLQMVAHAVATGGLFLAMALFERRNLPDELRRYGGMARHAPRLAALVLCLALASLGQPGMGSFPAELMILTGVTEFALEYALVAALGIILAAAYLLRWYQVIYTGEEGTYRRPSDTTAMETFILAVPIFLTFWIGFWPSVFLGPIQTWLQGVLQ